MLPLIVVAVIVVVARHSNTLEHDANHFLVELETSSASLFPLLSFPLFLTVQLCVGGNSQLLEPMLATRTLDSSLFSCLSSISSTMIVQCPPSYLATTPPSYSPWSCTSWSRRRKGRPASTTPPSFSLLPPQSDCQGSYCFPRFYTRLLSSWHH